jgi:esterase
LKLNYKHVGQGDPLIILHGLFGSSDNWLTLGKKFAEHFQVILVDQRNHGDSPHSTEWNYKAMAEDIYELVNSLGLDNINLMGHSMGGKTAMTFADQYPKLLKKLVIADIAPKTYPVRHQKIINGLLSIDLPNLQSRKEAEAQLAEYIPQSGIRQFLLKNLGRDKESGFFWKMNLPVIQDQLENIGEQTVPESKILIPTLFIRGLLSDYIEDTDVSEIRNYYSNSYVETIGNAGHWLHAEQPEVFYETVLKFLNN